jgi:hypothetical protein
MAEKQHTNWVDERRGPITFWQVAHLWAKEKVPRGPDVGCHVEPHHLLVG